MDACDVLIAGGGPAGSACAWKLRQAGLDVVVMDRASFPRDKVCAGWITPQVVGDLCLDLDEYGQRRTLQPITGFRVGLIGADRDVGAAYQAPISFGIRRCEFDHYLLRRSDARLKLGSPITGIRRAGDRWIVNDEIAAPMIVGAGGHFCPVARVLNGAPGGDADLPVVAAQEAEFVIDPRDAPSFTTDPAVPELYFDVDLKGYGWCFRKGSYVNVGFGCLQRHAVARATLDFAAFLAERGKVPRQFSWPWRGHAYLLHGAPGRRVVDGGVLLVGDAAGLAYPQSGEGIRPAIESGLMAASAIAAANGRYTSDRLEPYAAQLRARLEGGRIARALSQLVPEILTARLARRLLQTPAFVRHVVVDRWFLHAHQPALIPAG